MDSSAISHILRITGWQGEISRLPRIMPLILLMAWWGQSHDDPVQGDTGGMARWILEVNIGGRRVTCSSNRNEVDRFQLFKLIFILRIFFFPFTFQIWPNGFSIRGEKGQGVAGILVCMAVTSSHHHVPCQEMEEKYTQRMRDSLSKENQVLTNFPSSLSRPVIIDWIIRVLNHSWP